MGISENDPDRRPQPATYNCSSMIIGKNASTTGKVILAHNEDDNDVVPQQFIVPRMKHSEDEMLSFDDGRAVIPQVPETYAYYWSEMRSFTERISSADTFVNEWGVAVVSDSCVPCKEEPSDPQTGKLAYGLRRLIAERSRTAREGVEIAIGLIERYGYSSCRSYQICDQNEGWVLQLAKGKHYAARRVPDDEVLYIPNWYTIHKIDFADTEHTDYYFADDLVSFSIKHGWYAPAESGDDSDFDFSKAYQAGEETQANTLRARGAWRLLLGRDPADLKQFSAKLGRKIGLEEAKKIMRFHYEGTPDDITDHYTFNPHMDPKRHFTICNAMTAESCVIVFSGDPALTCIWRAALTPCISPYVPWYLGISKAPRGYNWYDPDVAQATHFHPSASDRQYRPERAFWAFMTVKYLTDFDYKGTHGAIQNSIRELEANWNGEQEKVQKVYKDLLRKNRMLAVEFLTGYTGDQAQLAWDWAKNMTQRLGEARALQNRAGD